jgi:hypothetical protein
LKSADGGALEDSFLALGQFSDRNMKSFLALARTGILSRHQFVAALTMLPLSLSDKEDAQLDVLDARRKAVVLVTQDDLSQQKTLALVVIDEFRSKIMLRRSGEGSRNLPAE